MVRAYREERAHSLDSAVARGWLKPAAYAAEEEPIAERPYRSLLYTMMGIRPAVNA